MYPRSRLDLLLLLLPVLFLVVFFLWPLLYIVSYSLISGDKPLVSVWASIFDTVQLTVLWNTFRIAALVTLASLALGYPLAMFITNSNGLARNVAMAIVIIPFCTSVVVRAYAWIALFQRFGVVNKVLMWLGITHQPLKFLYTELGVIIGMTHALLPFMVFALVASLDRIDRTLVRAAETLGAGPLQVLSKVWIPMSMPGVLAGCLLVFISSLGFYVTPALLGGREQTMVAVLIEQYVNRTLNWSLASVLGTTLLLATCILYVFYERISIRAGSRVEG